MPDGVLWVLCRVPSTRTDTGPEVMAMPGDTEMEALRREASHADSEFCYTVKVAAHRDNIIATYGAWDEAEQRAYHEKKWSPDEVRIMVADGADVGWVRCLEGAERVDIGGLYLLPSHQRRGIGTIVLQRVLEEARAAGKALFLQVMKQNSALAFYRKLGFVVVRETETHFEMEGPAQG
jgi:ribosomal protein S18 acetylase RimI-like enzyme